MSIYPHICFIILCGSVGHSTPLTALAASRRRLITLRSSKTEFLRYYLRNAYKVLIKRSKTAFLRAAESRRWLIKP